MNDLKNKEIAQQISIPQILPVEHVILTIVQSDIHKCGMGESCWERLVEVVWRIQY